MNNEECAGKGEILNEKYGSAQCSDVLSELFRNVKGTAMLSDESEREQLRRLHLGTEKSNDV